MKALNREHFTNSGVLNDLPLLTRLAVEAGADEEGVKDFLNSKRGVEEILKVVDYVHELGIHSIPTLVVNGAVLVGGAAGEEEIFQSVVRVIEGGGEGGRGFGDFLKKIV